MQTSTPKKPGEVQDPSGVGNDDFDAGKKVSKFGYPVLALYELKTPLNIEEMKNTYDIPPLQIYFYAPFKLFEAIKFDDMINVF